jgi:prostaglandin-endoperoxide synthase 2
VNPGFGEHENWYRENWMSIEFNLLYRWHSLVPERIKVRGQERNTADVRWNNKLVVEGGGLASLFDEASRQPAGEIGLLNTPGFLLEIERKSLEIGRDVSLASYNDYREACTYPRMKSFSDVSSNPEIQARLKQTYRRVDDIELYVGLFAENVREFAALPTLMGTMVGGDAFSQALTNPLLSSNIFKEATFSKAGMKVIEETQRLADLVSRNIPAGDQPLVTLTQHSWQH